MRPGGRAVFVLLCVGALRPVRAQQPAAWTLERALAVALRQNADILTARLRVDSAHGEQQIARAIPNPVLYSAPNQPWQYTVTLPLDVTPLRFLRTRAAGRGADAARSDVTDRKSKRPNSSHANTSSAASRLQKKARSRSK